MTDHQTYSRETARPAPARGLLPEIWRWICTAYLKVSGWKMEGDWPAHKKMVLLAVPHTSNWDGVNMIAAAGYFRIKLMWMGKKSLTMGPFGWLVKATGCVPIDRTAAHAVVSQMRDAFNIADDMILAVAPEGKREYTEEWKKGFYQIAKMAKVPLVMTVLDYGSKTIRVAGELSPSGDYDADIMVITEHYLEAKGKHPEKFAGVEHLRTK